MNHFLLKNIRFGFKKSVYNSIDLSSANRFNANDLTIERVHSLKPLPEFTPQSLGFGFNSTDHILCIQSQKGIWGKPRIQPMKPIPIHPFNSTLHYGVQCFEGMKAYKDDNGKIRLFRPECNMLRLKRSSKRIALPDFDGNDLLKCIEKFVLLEQRWIPSISEFSLYLRPLHISSENSLGVKPPGSSMLMVMASPVGPYYPSGFKPISLAVSEKAIRSAPGGMGSFKVGGNYGPTLSYTNQVIAQGHNQALWLHGNEINQAGASNIFFVFKAPNGKTQIATPELQDLILPGVSRDTIIRLCEQNPDYIVSERKITIDQVIERNQKGELLEAFGSGTAVIVGSVKNIHFRGKDYPIHYDHQLGAGKITYSIRKQLLDIQQGRLTENNGWSKILN